MILLSDTQEIASRFGDYIEDLRDVFNCNGVDFGSREDFFAFARTVKYHSELRGDVARVAKAVTEKETDVSLRMILTIIAVASGGVDVATADREMSVPINLVAESLIRDGVCSPRHADDPDRPCLNLTVKQPGQISALEATRDTHMEAGVLNALAESLTQLELNSLQLKIYLDSIDQRIDRIEPGLKSAPALVLPDYSRDARVRFSQIIPSETDFQVQNDPSQSNERAATGVRREFQWLSSFRTRFALPVLVGVCTLLLAASVFWVFGRDTSYAVVRPANVSAEGGVSSGSASVSPVVTANDPSFVPLIVRGSSASADKPARSSKKLAQIALRSASRSTSVASDDSETPRVMASGTSDGSEEPDRVSKLDSGLGSNHPVDVSSSVMAANLVSAPKPSYPTLASLTRMQGNVVMRAVISKDGNVEHLQVIQGHRLLRGAAKSAVRNWRYRPYKIDGVPVEVATTVSVDFKLHH
jgi:TonB family protein